MSDELARKIGEWLQEHQPEYRDLYMVPVVLQAIRALPEQDEVAVRQSMLNSMYVNATTLSRELAAALEEARRLRGHDTPGPWLDCTDCGRRMVWQREVKEDNYLGSWMCPNCVLFRMEDAERARDEARNRVVKMWGTNDRLCAEKLAAERELAEIKKAAEAVLNDPKVGRRWFPGSRFEPPSVTALRAALRLRAKP